MKILMSGASGMVGTALSASLEKAGHDVVRLVRRAAGAREVTWDPAEGTLDVASIEGVEGVVHLAGENIASGRWTAAQKARIRDSRVDGTNLLARTLAQTKKPPRAFISASAIGFYGHRADAVLVESSPRGEGFLAEVCGAWEAATAPAQAVGIRTVHLRLGIVLSPKGGALKRMLTPFKLGGGGRLGSGKQWMSWLSLNDAVGQIEFALATSDLSGAVNAVTGAVTNLEFTKTLGRVLRRPTILPLPAALARILIGEMADELMLASTRVDPKVLREKQYRPKHPELEGALRDLLAN